MAKRTTPQPRKKPSPETKSQPPHQPSPTARLIRELRIKNGLNQTQMAERLGIDSLSSYVRIEAGKYRPSIDMLEKLMQDFGATPYDLLVPPNVPDTKLTLIRELIAGLHTLSDRAIGELITHATFFKRGQRVAVRYAVAPSKESDD